MFGQFVVVRCEVLCSLDGCNKTTARLLLFGFAAYDVLLFCSAVTGAAPQVALGAFSVS